MSRPMTNREAAVAVVRRLREKGHQALWAGGCVRDMLLGHQPVDIDVATDAPPERVIKLFSRTRKVGVQFGVVLVHQGQHWIETATFRCDLDYSDGRRPGSVVFTTAEEDARRRDFTINGLFFDPIEEKVIDYVDGRADLQARIIRAIGDPAHRFAEDHLRMLRAVRFSARFAFPIEPLTADAIREQADRITLISPERIHEELQKMLAHPSRAQAVEQMAALGLLDHIWKDTAWPAGRVTVAVAVLAGLPAHADSTLALAALLNDTSSQQAQEMTRTLRCSNQQIEEVAWLLEHVDELHEADRLPLPVFKKLMARQRFDGLLDLHQAVCTVRGLPIQANQSARRRQADIPPDQVAPPPLVTGQDLIERGLEPGPNFKNILTRLYDQQLDNQITTRQAALEKLHAFISDATS